MSKHSVHSVYMFDQLGFKWYLNRKFGFIYSLDEDDRLVRQYYVGNPPDPLDSNYLEFVRLMDKAVDAGFLRPIRIYAVRDN